LIVAESILKPFLKKVGLSMGDPSVINEWLKKADEDFGFDV